MIEAVPKRARNISADGEERLVSSTELAIRGVGFLPNVDAADSVRMNNARRAMRDGQRTPLKILVSPKGKLWIDDGRHRYLAALEQFKPVRVRFLRGHGSMDSP